LYHHIHTIYGNSIQSAGQKTWDTPISGIGQGNGASSPIWVAVSSPMFDIMCQEGFEALLQRAISQQQQQILGFAFVYDMDLCMTHSSDMAE